MLYILILYNINMTNIYKVVKTNVPKIKKRQGYLFAAGYIAGAYIHTNMKDEEYKKLKKLLYIVKLPFNDVP